MSKPIPPLDRPPALASSVQASLRAYILENALQPGDPLPPEGTLARQLGVSRNSIREGIRGLESVGLIEVRRGIGLFVGAFSLGPLIDNLPVALEHSVRDVEEILEIRRALEVALIEKAISRMSEEDLSALRSIVAAMGERAKRGEHFPDEDKQFHQQLFRCLGNSMLLSLIEIFWMVFYRVSGFAKLENPDPLATYRDHAAILDALVARDAAKARERLDQHYSGVSAVLDKWRSQRS